MDQADGGGLLTIFHVLIVTRWLHFASVFILFGSSLFWFIMTKAFPRARRATENLLRAAAPVAAISGLCWLGAIVANMTGGFAAAADPESLRLFFLQTQFGPVAALRIVLLAGAVIAAVLPLRTNVMLIVQLNIGALLLINQAWLGHAAEGGAGAWGALMIGVYSVHVLAAAAWVGGLPPLLFTLHELRKAGAEDAQKQSVAVLSRYSVMAMIAVCLIVASGVANAGFRTGYAPGKMVWGDYGLALSLKIGLVAAMLVLAGFNRFVALPRLRAAPGGAAQMSRLRLSVMFELVLGVVVLGAAALLGITPPPQ
jgi:putative copper resistance protein D